MLGQTLIRLTKNGKELSPYLAIGPIIHPYKGERVDNEVVLELQTIPEECRYLGVGNTTVKVKTPKKEITHKLLLTPEGFWDEWVDQIAEEPQINDALIRILGSLVSHLQDNELQKAVEIFCSFLLPKTETFLKELQKLEDLALKEPIWFMQIYDYEPKEEVCVVDGSTWMELSNPDFETSYLIVSPSKRIEIPPIRNLEYTFFRELWRNLNKGFAVELILTPETFRFIFKVFGIEYLKVWKDFEWRKIHREFLSQSPIVKALVKGLIETNPLEFVGPSIFGKELLESNFNELLNALKRIT